jgi:hypothetical protein
MTQSNWQLHFYIYRFLGHQNPGPVDDAEEVLSEKPKNISFSIHINDSSDFTNKT